MLRTFNLRCRRPWLHFLVILGTVGCYPRLAAAIEIEQVIWGFDGKVVAHKFNPVSILISNPSANAFEETITLRKSVHGVSQTGATLVEPVFVSPFAQKWVQFYPYIKTHWESWSLSWPGQQYRLPELNSLSSQGADVLLTNSRQLASRRLPMMTFPEELFPPTVTATDGLKLVVLDHVPEWQGQALRQQAFKDWLYRGGRLHLLNDGSGNRLRFRDELVELNAPLGRFHVGAGTVSRQLPARPESPKPTNKNVPQDYARAWFDDFADIAFGNLKQMTRPNHNWPVIYLMAVSYIVIIFPGLFILGKKRADYRLVYGALLGTVVLFSFGFATIGSRGYGEATTVNSVAVARSLPDGNLDVTGWSNVFVTSGADYTIQFAAPASLFSTCQEAESVRGMIDNVSSGSFVVDIPPYSSRTFGFRTKLVGGGLKVGKLIEGVDTSMGSFEIEIDDSFPKAPGISMYAIRGTRMYPMVRKGLRLVSTSPAALTDSLSDSIFDQFNQFRYGYNYGDAQAGTKELFQTMDRPLIAQNLGLKSQNDVKKYKSPSNLVRLFVYAPMPEEFFIQNPKLGKQAGRVLYTFDLFQR